MIELYRTDAVLSKIPPHVRYLNEQGERIGGAEEINGEGTYFTKNNGSIRGVRVKPDSKTYEKGELIVLEGVDLVDVELGEAGPRAEMLPDKSIELDPFVVGMNGGVFRAKEDSGLKRIVDEAFEAA